MNALMNEKISSNRERILLLWQAAALPQGCGLPLKGSSKTRFIAPADYLLKEETEALLNWLISEEEPVKARSSLEEICKYKAVQGLNPSEALGFILDLKSIVRLVLGNGESESSQIKAYADLDRRIDQLMLLAFDEYCNCRERIMEIRVDEMRRLSGMSA